MKNYNNIIYTDSIIYYLNKFNFILGYPPCKSIVIPVSSNVIQPKINLHEFLLLNYE